MNKQLNLSGYIWMSVNSSKVFLYTCIIIHTGGRRYFTKSKDKVLIVSL